MTIVAVGLTLVAASTAGARTLARFSYSGTCDDAIFLIPVPAANVRPRLPRGYVALGDEGGPADRAILAVTVCTGSDLALDGRPVRDAVFNDVMVPIQAPPGCGRVAGGCDGFHFYALWQTSGSRPIRIRQARLGETGALVKGMTFGVRHTLPEGSLLERGSIAGGSIGTAMPWRYSPFSGDFRFTGTPAAGSASGNSFWQVTRSGSVLRVTTAFANQSLTRPVTGTLHAAPGSPLARMLGAPDRTVAGTYSSFQFIQTAETWAPARRPNQRR